MRKQYRNGAEPSRSCNLNMIAKIGYRLARILRDAMIVRAFVILPVTLQNESELKRLLAA